MRRFTLYLAAGLLVVTTALGQGKSDMMTPFPAFRIAGNLYYVGSKDLASYLVTTPSGDILINSSYQDSVPLIQHSIESLGFKMSDVKILLISHAHDDHDAGSALIKKLSGAKYMVMDADVPVVESGKDYFYTDAKHDYPGTKVDRVLHDGDEVKLGGAVLVAHKTPGHTRGCTTWTMRSHLPGEPAGLMRNIVIVGGTSFWSEYHFVATRSHPASYPGIAQDFQHTFAVLRDLPCDVFLGAHGGYFDMLTKLQRYPREGPRVFIDPSGYKVFVTEAQAAFAQALSKQQAAVAAR